MDDVGGLSGTEVTGIEEGLMDTHLLIGVAVMLGLIGLAASRDLLRRMRPQPQLVPIRAERRDSAGYTRGRR
jgi:hypothetical protein